jgi:hypothetical protein
MVVVCTNPEIILKRGTGETRHIHICQKVTAEKEGLLVV